MNERDKSKCLNLYNDWKQRRIKEIESQERLMQETHLMANFSHTDSKSKIINNDLVRKMFTKIFTLILDEGNILTGTNFSFEKLPQKISVMVMPLLNELREQNETLTLDEFNLACTHIYAYLPFEEKQLLNEWYFSTVRKKNLFETELTFKVILS